MSKEASLYLQFQRHSYEFLRHVAEMSLHTESGRSVTFNAKEMAAMQSTIEFFYEGTESIFMLYEQRLRELQLMGVNDRVKVKILENELRNTYNEIYRVRDKIPETARKIFTSTNLPSKEELARMEATYIRPPQKQQTDGRSENKPT